MSRFDPADMLLFAKAAELRSISAAARALMRPKATISRAVARLEEALQARLLERSSRHVSLTEAGRVFLTHCQHVAEEVEAAKAAVGELQASVSGLLRVAVPMTFGRAVLAPVLSKFLLAYPDLRMELRMTDRLLDPIEDGFDVVVRRGPLPDSSLMAREVGRATYGAFANSTYLSSHSPVAHPDDLAFHWVLDSFAGAESLVWSFKREGVVRRVEVRPRLDMNDAIMRRDAAIDGVGIALLPTWICKEAFEAGTLRPVIADWTPERTVDVFAVWSGRRNISPRVRAFLDFLVDAVPLEPTI